MGCVATVVGLPRPPTLIEPLLFVLDDLGLRDDLLPAVKAIRRNAMPQVSFSRCRVDRKRRAFQLVVRPTHASRRRGSTTFLNCHIILLTGSCACTTQSVNRLAHLRLQMRKWPHGSASICCSRRNILVAGRRIRMRHDQWQRHHQILLDNVERPNPCLL